MKVAPLPFPRRPYENAAVQFLLEVVSTPQNNVDEQEEGKPIDLDDLMYYGSHVLHL
jgi:hypothetical protein